MRHRVTVETKGLLEALDHIRLRVQPRLDRVSPEAREEWVNLLLRFPDDADVGMGVIDLSCETLAQMIAKASRFEQIVKATGCPQTSAGVPGAQLTDAPTTIG
jgi:hypothetical protein